MLHFCELGGAKLSFRSHTCNVCSGNVQAVILQLRKRVNMSLIGRTWLVSYSFIMFFPGNEGFLSFVSKKKEKKTWLFDVRFVVKDFLYLSKEKKRKRVNNHNKNCRIMGTVTKLFCFDSLPYFHIILMNAMTCHQTIFSPLHVVRHRCPQ
jgi:hypothetical protein